MIADFKVLFLTNNENTLPLQNWLRERCTLISTGDRITLEFVKGTEPDLVVSFNYRYLIKGDVIDFLGRRIINLHMSYLPWNRGSHPNFWSFFEGTPKGVTIHQLEKGLDTGDIIVQKELLLEEEKETFTTSYTKLLEAMMTLFQENWEVIRQLGWEGKHQTERGTYHRMKDLEEVCERLPVDWECGIADYLKQYDAREKKVYIRTDMNETIATGHMMRCLSIADALQEKGWETVFLTADEKPLELLERRGYKAIVLNTEWNRMEEELPVLLPILRKYRIRKLLVDSYQVTAEYFRQLEEVTRVIYLDDLDAFCYPVSSLICYANYYPKLSYGNKGKVDGFYLGTDYMPLRQVYRNRPPKPISSGLEKILILSGGSDNYHMIQQLTERFREKKEFRVAVICGAFYPDFEGLKERFEDCPHLNFYQNVENLEEFMVEADLAVSAGGTTLYELCAVGTPTISYSFADNQLKNVEQFDQDGLISYAGDVRKDQVYDRIEVLLGEYRDPLLRQERSLRMQACVDGRGAERIALLLIGESI